MPRNAAPSIIAHRGAGHLAPENTLAALRTAIRLGVQGVEFDIQATSDGDLVVFHDTTLDRTTNGTGPVGARTLEALRTLDAGSRFDPAFRGERIPTLREALQCISGRVTAYIELKDAALIPRTLEVIRAVRAASWCTVISFSEDAVSRLARHCPDIPRALLIHPSSAVFGDVPALIRRASALPADIIGVVPSRMTAGLLDACHAMGIRVMTGPLDDAQTIAASVALGPDFVLTNRPDVMREYL